MAELLHESLDLLVLVHEGEQEFEDRCKEKEEEEGGHTVEGEGDPVRYIDPKHTTHSKQIKAPNLSFSHTLSFRAYLLKWSLTLECLCGNFRARGGGEARDDVRERVVNGVLAAATRGPPALLRKLVEEQLEKKKNNQGQSEEGIVGE